AATLCCGKQGVLHGAFTYLLQNNDGQIRETHSISAGLDYPGVGPEHSFLKDSRRVTYRAVTDQEALTAFTLLSRTEGIIPALESAHALAQVIKMAAKTSQQETVIVCLSGRGDKDVEIVKKKLPDKINQEELNKNRRDL
ncbi:MAG: tryptophan synthase subunit beta, partial [bacterium]